MSADILLCNFHPCPFVHGIARVHTSAHVTQPMQHNEAGKNKCFHFNDITIHVSGVAELINKYNKSNLTAGTVQVEANQLSEYLQF